MDGRVPDAELLGRIRRGQIGGVILYRGRNYASAAHLRSITGTLQAAAADAGRLPLLIAVDQEGGPVRQVPWAPPTLSPARMGADGSASEALGQGAAHRAGAQRPGRQRRPGPGRRRARVAAVVHAPGRPDVVGIGVGDERARKRLRGRPRAGWGDPGDEALPGPRLRGAEHRLPHRGDRRLADAARPRPLPYRAAISARVPMIMLSNAVYTAYDGGERRRMVVRDRDAAPARRPGIPRRHDHRLAGRRRPRPPDRRRPARDPRRPGGHRHDPRHGIGGDLAGRLRLADAGGTGRRDQPNRSSSPRTAASGRSNGRCERRDD